MENKYLLDTVKYKILEGEDLGEFGELHEICQNFPSKKSKYS